MPHSMALRPHQEVAMQMIRHSLAEGKFRPVLQAPCGFGKTVVAAEIVRGALAKGKRLTFCVPSLSLIDQTFDRFVENGVDPADIGIIQASHPWRRPYAPIQIATAQTLKRREMPECDIVVIDEAHVRHEVYTRWLDPAKPRRPIIGLTATPWAAGMGLYFDNLLKPITMNELTKLGYLSKFVVFAPSCGDLSGVRTVAGDYHEGELAEAMAQGHLVGDIVTTWLTKGPGGKTLCFAVNRAHAQMIHDHFESAGVFVAYVDAFTPREERVEIGKKLVSGDVQVVCNIGTLTTGIDWDIRCIIMARPTKSRSLFVQIIGRGLRTAEGKDALLILDHSNTHLTLGMVDEIDQESMSELSGKIGTQAKRAEDKDKISLPKPCASCGCLIPPKFPACPACGFVTKRASDVASVAGELVAFGAKAKKRLTDSARDRLAREGKAEIYAQIRGLGASRGWSDGRMSHCFREIFGVWPNKLRHIASVEPGSLLRAWVTSRNIAFAKSRRSA